MERSRWGCRDALVDVPVLGTRITFVLLDLGAGGGPPLKSGKAAGFLPETDVPTQAFFLKLHADNICSLNL